MDHPRRMPGVIFKPGWIFMIIIYFIDILEYD
jgi:hypothetical protein